MTEKVDTQSDRFCALGRTEPTKAVDYYCYGIRWRAHGGDGVFCRNHKHLGGTREELYERAFAAGVASVSVRTAMVDQKTIQRWRELLDQTTVEGDSYEKRRTHLGLFRAYLTEAAEAAQRALEHNPFPEGCKE